MTADVGAGDAETATVTFDPAHARVGVPFDHLALVRREAPVYPTPAGAWYLARSALVEAALKDVFRLAPVRDAVYPPIPGSLGHLPIPVRLFA